MKTATSIREINHILDKQSDNIARMGWACDHIAWLHKFKKAPADILNALIVKATAIMEGSWYGDEPEEYTIRAYIQGV
jgi:hypothetical protein